MKINIIGATGNLGGEVVEALLARGTEPGDLIATARNLTKAEPLAEKGIDVRYGDYNQYESLVQAFAGTDVQLLISTMADSETRVRQHANALSAAREAGVGRVVFVGFQSTDLLDSHFKAAPFYAYAEVKTRQSGMAWTILRNGMYTEAMAAWAPQFAEAGFIPYPVGEGRIAFVTRRSLARATAAVLTGKGHEGKIYRLTGPEALHMDELAQVIGAATGKPVRYAHPSEEDYAKFAQANGMPESFLPLVLSMYRAVRAGEFAVVTDDIERLSGQRPETVAEYLGNV